jgi:D-amino-acid dehydrogenase
LHVLVLGAGILGVSSAWFLRQRGCDVTVVDRQPAAALETSFANGGQISVSQSEPWANPAAPWKVARWLTQADAPLLFRPRLDLQQWRWGLGFLRECLPGRAARNTAHMVALGRYSRDTLRQLRAETGIEYDAQTRGILQLYFDAQSFEAAQGGAELMQRLGVRREVVTPARARAIEPALEALGERLVGATYCEDDESGDAHRFTQGLAERAAAAGVVFRYDTNVCSLLPGHGGVAGVRVRDASGQVDTLTADAYLVCLGSYSPLLVAPLGLYLPIYPAKGYSATLTANDRAPTVSLTDDAAKMVYTRLGTQIRIAGTAELGGYQTGLNEVRCEALLKRYFSLFPDSADPQTVQFWTGLRPATPSNVPLIGRTRLGNLYLNTGHGTLGWTEGPGSGRAVADLITGREPDIAFPFLRG